MRRTRRHQWQRRVDLITSLFMLGATVLLIWQYWPREPPRPTVPTERLAVGDSPTIGDPHGEAVVVVYTDFQCPFCARFALGPLKDFKRGLARGNTAVIIRHLPLEAIHPEAFHAAVAAECAKQQGRFDEFHDLLFERQRGLAELSQTGFNAAVVGLGLDSKAFGSCLAGSAAAERVRSDALEAERLGLSATPTVLIGRRTGDSIQPVEVAGGPLTANGLQERVDAVLDGN